MIGGEDPSPLLSCASHIRLDSVVYLKQPRKGQQVCWYLFFLCVPLCYVPPSPPTVLHTSQYSISFITSPILLPSLFYCYTYSFLLFSPHPDPLPLSYILLHLLCFFFYYVVYCSSFMFFLLLCTLLSTRFSHPHSLAFLTVLLLLIFTKCKAVSRRRRWNT